MNRPLLRVWVGSLGLAALHCGSSSGSSASTSPADAGPVVDAGTTVDSGHVTADAGTDVKSCGSTGITCTRTQAVVSKVTLPTSESQFAVDLDGDGHPDDALGAFWSELPGYDAQASEDAVVASGAVVLLLDESSVDPQLVSDPGSAVVDIFQGLPTTSPNFTGAGAFTVDPTAMTGTFDGSIVASVFASPAAASVTRAPVVNILLAFGTATAALPMHVAQVSVTNTGGHPGAAQINGAFKKTDIDTILIPALATELTAEIASDPTSSTSSSIVSLFDSGGCTNPDGTMAAKGDGVISPCELLGNAILGSLLAPDVQLFDASGNYKPTPGGTPKDSLSAGFEVTLVGATF